MSFAIGDLVRRRACPEEVMRVTGLNRGAHSSRPMVTCAIECPDGRVILTRWYEETLEHAIDAGDYNARARRLIVAVRRADANGMSEETLTSTVESILSDTWNEAIEEVLTTLSKEHSRKARVT